MIQEKPNTKTKHTFVIVKTRHFVFAPFKWHCTCLSFSLANIDLVFALRILCSVFTLRSSLKHLTLCRFLHWMESHPFERESSMFGRHEFIKMKFRQFWYDNFHLECLPTISAYCIVFGSEKSTWCLQR